MSQSKSRQVRAKESEEVERRRAAIIAAITERGEMTSAEIRKIVPSVSHNTLGFMVRQGKLVSTGKQRFRVYALPGKECKRVEVEPGPTLWEQWPVSVPNVSGKPRYIKEEHSYSVIGSCGVAIQSSVPVLMLFGG